MSVLTDLLVQVGTQVGWDFLLFVLFVWEVFAPERLHPLGGTKLRQLLEKPSPGVIAALEAVYDRHDDLSKEELVERLNGDLPRAWQFEEMDEVRRRGSD